MTINIPKIKSNIGIPLEYKMYRDVAQAAVDIIYGRFCDSITAVKAEIPARLNLDEEMIYQSMAGQGGMVVYFCEGNGGLLKLCSNYGMTDYENLDVDALDAACEILNCVNGRFVTELSEKGLYLELQPPSTGVFYGSVSARSMCRIQMDVDGKNMYILIAELA